MKAVLSGCQELHLDMLLQHIPKDLQPGLLRAAGQEWREQHKNLPAIMFPVLQYPQLDIHLRDPVDKCILERG